VSDPSTVSLSDIVTVSLEEEMKRSYLDYAMSVIVARALPDARDGLKPVHRRILHLMNEVGLHHNKPYKKSARVVGEVMAKYHPHGNMAIYEAMVRMAQDFSMRLPLIDGQGNFGSMDGDPPAAERYTEARLAKVSRSLLDDIDEDTVEFRPNYDESEREPVVLPARFPNLLVNGANGIAVGMATNIPTHNLGELIDACCAYVDNPDIPFEDLIKYIPGPDFPTGGIIMGRAGVLQYMRTGKGSIVLRSKTHIEEIRKDREAIIVTEIPYQVNKARMIERIAEVVKNKVIEGISDLRDESDRDGVRVVIELKREAMADIVLNQLYRHTPLQTSIGANVLALDRGQPRMMGILDILKCFIEFREEVIVRRIKFRLAKAQRRAHVLIGLAVAVANIDEIIKLIRAASDPTIAKEQMMARAWEAVSIIPLIQLVSEPGTPLNNNQYKLSEEQAKAILDLRLHRLTGLERDKIAQELQEIVDQIQEYLSTLASRDKIVAIMKQEFLEVREFADPRRTQITDEGSSVNTEDLIQQEDMVITVSQKGYIKRVPLSAYRAQRRGGKGRSGMATREEDVVNEVFVAHTHTPLLFFSTRGLAYILKVYELPLATPQSIGKAIINLLPLQPNETISTIMPLYGTEADWEKMSIVFATSRGNVRRNKLSDFTNVRANGKIAMKIEEGESLIGVKMCDLSQDVFLTTTYGKCIRFLASDVREFVGRTSTGVRGIKLAPKDEVIAISILSHVDFTMEERNAYIRLSRQERGNLEEEPSTDEIETPPGFTLSPDRYAQLATQEQFILSVTNKGFGKRTSAYEYRITNRGGQGLANMSLTHKNGQVVGSFIADDTDDIVMVTDAGQLIRFPVNQVRIAGRSTQGVTLFRVAQDEKVVSVARIVEEKNSTDDSEEPLPLLPPSDTI
jgi:DNA gyrase subunit A